MTLKWKNIGWTKLEPTCGERPTPGSSARCERKPGHAELELPDPERGMDFHAGRTFRGCWKLWPAIPDTPNALAKDA